jgi:hypothetical protein
VFLLLADMLLRVVPLRRFAFRALEGSQRRGPSAMGPFTPNYTFSTWRSYGDLASVGNLARMREYRSEEFVTDSRGFHNSPGVTGVPEGIFIGDSFAVASEGMGDNTLAAKISILRHKPLYNAGGGTPLNLASIRALTKQLGMTKGYVLYEFLERHLSERPLLHTETGKQGFGAILPTALGPVLWETWRLPAWHFVEFSPLKALAQRVDKRFSNGVLLPNHYAKNVLVRTIANGDTMLFLPGDARDGYVAKSQLKAWVSYWNWLSQELEKDDLTLMVLLVPDKYTVYQRWFVPAETELPNRENLLELERSLKESRTPVVNLIDLFRRDAGAELDKHRYLYWKDDSHWNERGIAIAADEINRELQARRFGAEPGAGGVIRSSRALTGGVP